MPLTRTESSKHLSACQVGETYVFSNKAIPSLCSGSIVYRKVHLNFQPSRAINLAYKITLLQRNTKIQRYFHAYLFICDLYFCKCIIFFNSWENNWTCTSCRTYTLVCGRPNLGKCVNCLADLCPLNDKLLACNACWNILNWVTIGTHHNSNWQTNVNEIEGVLFFPKISSFSRLIATWSILNFRDHWRHFAVHISLSLSLIDFCSRFIFGFHGELHHTYSFHIRQIFFFTLVCKVCCNLDYTLPRRTYLYHGAEFFFKS
jgi:hypothetical protein